MKVPSEFAINMYHEIIESIMIYITHEISSKGMCMRSFSNKEHFEKWSIHEPHPENPPATSNTQLFPSSLMPVKGHNSQALW